MNRTEIEEALREKVAHSCLEWQQTDHDLCELTVHTMIPDDAGTTDLGEHGPEVVIGPFKCNGEVGITDVLLVGEGARTARSIDEVIAAVALEVQLHSDEAEESLAQRGRRLRGAISDAVEAAWQGMALSQDWAESILANLSEPDKHDEVGWAILDHESEEMQPTQRGDTT
jgi:hypothetical protein